MKPLTRKQELLAALAEGRVPNITPLTAEEILLYEQAKREAASKNPKWEDIADKPFDENVVRGDEIVAETGVEFTAFQLNGVDVRANKSGFVPFDSLADGDMVEVVLDGVSYISTVREQWGLKDFGNKHMIGSINADTGEPFYCSQDTSTVGFLLDSSYAPGTHTVGVYKATLEAKPLDPTYLPKIAAVPDASGDTPTAAEFNALLAALRDAGYMATDTGL